jgi:hypothetical protein
MMPMRNLSMIGIIKLLDLLTTGKIKILVVGNAVTVVIAKIRMINIHTIDRIRDTINQMINKNKVFQIIKIKKY